MTTIANDVVLLVAHSYKHSGNIFLHNNTFLSGNITIVLAYAFYSNMMILFCVVVTNELYKLAAINNT